MTRFSVEVTRHRIETVVFNPVEAPDRQSATDRIQKLVDAGSIPESFVVSGGVTPWEVLATTELPEIKETHVQDRNQHQQRRLWP